MSKLYRVRGEYEADWKNRLSEEDYARLCGEPFDIDVIVDLAKEWDTALQRMLNEVEVISDDHTDDNRQEP
ncbi:MAG: hypothetical protein ILO68_01235 [Clostridia bacterium]|nr:hypothetical protein [Clostridia bacterium]